MAKDTYTLVTLQQQNNRHDAPYAFRCAGCLTREEAIRIVRERAIDDLARVREFLATPVDKLYVRVERGEHRVEIVEVLDPPKRG